MVLQDNSTYNTTSNVSFSNAFTPSPSPLPPLWDTICLAVIGTLALLANGTVIFLVTAKSSLRKHPSPNWFILSLAVGDLCVGGVYAPSRLVCVYFGDSMCPPPTWSIVYFFQSVFLSSSVANLCALTFDRYLAVVRPFAYQNTMTKTRVLHIIQLSWLSAVVLNIPFLIMEFTFLEFEVRMSIRFVHLVAQMTIFAFIPCAFMIYAYLVIFLIVRRHRMDIKRQEMQLAANFHVEMSHNQHHNTSKDGTMKAVAVIVFLFIVCTSLVQWLTICNLVESCQSVPSNESAAYFIIFTLLHFKSAINVVVYALLRRDFQRELRSLFCWK